MSIMYLWSKKYIGGLTMTNENVFIDDYDLWDEIYGSPNTEYGMAIGEAFTDDTVPLWCGATYDEWEELYESATLI